MFTALGQSSSNSSRLVNFSSGEMFGVFLPKIFPNLNRVSFEGLSSFKKIFNVSPKIGNLRSNSLKRLPSSSKLSLRSYSSSMCEYAW